MEEVAGLGGEVSGLEKSSGLSRRYDVGVCTAVQTSELRQRRCRRGLVG
jgi:hypothetical protein